MKHIHKLVTTAAAVSLMFASMVAPVFAQVGGAAPDAGLSALNKDAGFGNQDLYSTVGSLIHTVLKLVGVIAIILVIYGGFKWMTAGGSEEAVEEAKKILYSGAIGIVIILSAYALTTFVLSSIGGATGYNGA